MSKTLKNILTYAGIVLLFLVLAYSFVPEVLSGKVVNQSDFTGYSSMAKESTDWNRDHPDDPPRWTGAMFSGMPTTSFHPSGGGDLTQHVYGYLFKGKRPANWLFVSLLGAFLLMLSLGIDKFLAIGGAIAVTFCSYNLQIIKVGHNTKMQALALIPWVLAAVIFTYKKAMNKKDGDVWRDWLPATALGAALFGLALSLQIKANHQQITYYLALMIAVYVIALFVGMITGKEFKSKVVRFFSASALLLVLGLVGVATNANKLAPLYEYTKYTMRGGSELSHPSGGQINGEGLQLDYATAWSYGWEELPNMMIPNFNGGSSSGAVNPDKSEVVKLFRKAGQGNPREVAKALPLYWGPQPFTAGPMYMGAITIFLFLLGLFLYKGKEKWWMLAATILAIFLALGNHFLWFTKLFYDYAPMYNKFRTVSMALVTLQFTLPMLGFLVLNSVLKQEYSKKEFLKAGWIALALTAGFSFLCVLFPGIAGSFSGASDSSMQDVVVDALKVDRRHLLVSDALWSTILILVTFGLILWAYKVPPKAPKSYETNPGIGKARRIEALVGICLLVLVNMFVVGKRYLNSDDFMTPRQFSSHFNQRTVDKIILEDKSLSYRVADLTTDIFNDSYNSFWHKNIGGYSPAKLQRYQDLIDRYLTKELQSIYTAFSGAKTLQDMENAIPDLKVMSALNTKYLIVNEEVPPVVNRGAYGNAWFVDGFVGAATPDEEIGLIESTDLRTTAIIGADYVEAIRSLSGVEGPGDKIELTYYSPNELHYHYVAASDRPVVFSEIFYPKGWHASVSGSEVNLFRVDWILRGAILPAGEHDIVMRFDPKVYPVSENVSKASSIVLLLLIAAAVAGMVLGRKKETETE
ncbi:MAG: DUF2339 domain-containing protein [Bacteroidales bacterium]|nr:DUF2339 domain-containing protein [Bacteroidales bacterium]